MPKSFPDEHKKERFHVTVDSETYSRIYKDSEDLGITPTRVVALALHAYYGNEPAQGWEKRDDLLDAPESNRTAVLIDSVSKAVGRSPSSYKGHGGIVIDLLRLFKNSIFSDARSLDKVFFMHIKDMLESRKVPYRNVYKHFKNAYIFNIYKNNKL